MADLPRTPPPLMCPHCGALCGIARGGLIRDHDGPDGQPCPGRGQNPRNSESDARPLWNGERNPHFAG